MTFQLIGGNAMKRVCFRTVVAAILAAVFVLFSTPDCLGGTTEYLVIYAVGLEDAASSLVNHRETASYNCYDHFRFPSDAVSVSTIDQTQIPDIGDGDGLTDSDEIRRYIDWRHTTDPLRFVTLLGDQTTSPPRQCSFAEVPFYSGDSSDEPYVDFDEDGLADLALGRIPARTAGEAMAAVSKIISMDNTPWSDADMEWRNNVLITAFDESFIDMHDNMVSGEYAHEAAGYLADEVVSPVMRACGWQAIGYSSVIGGEEARNQYVIDMFNAADAVGVWIAIATTSTPERPGNFLSAELNPQDRLDNPAENRFPLALGMSCLTGVISETSGSMYRTLLVAEDKGILAAVGPCDAVAQPTVIEFCRRLMLGLETTPACDEARSLGRRWFL